MRSHSKLYDNNERLDALPSREQLLSGIQARDPLLQRAYSSQKKSMQSLQKLNNIMIPALKGGRRRCRQLPSKTHCKDPFSLAKNMVPNSKRMLPCIAFICFTLRRFVLLNLSKD